MEFEALDQPVNDLCRVIREFPMIDVTSTGDGLLEAHRRGEPWEVFFRPEGEPSLEAYASIEFIASLQREARHAGLPYTVTCNAFPPALNGICESLYFVLASRQACPERLAGWLRNMRLKLFRAPDGLGAPGRAISPAK